MVYLRQIENKIDKKNCYKLYKDSFPKFERKPFKFLLNNQKKNIYDLFVVEDDEKTFFGLAFLVKYNDLVLLDFLAIDKQFQGQTLGTQTLKKLQELYKDKKLIIEIESTTCGTAKNITQRIRRKSFYLKNNMCPQKYNIILNNCEMEILTFNGDVTFEEYFSIFLMLYNDKKANKYIQLKK